MQLYIGNYTVFQYFLSIFFSRTAQYHCTSLSTASELKSDSLFLKQELLSAIESPHVIGLQVRITVNMKSSTSWVITYWYPSYPLESNRRIGRIYSHRHQGLEVSHARNQHETGSTWNSTAEYLNTFIQKIARPHIKNKDIIYGPY
jgi:hypothetical protein